MALACAGMVLYGHGEQYRDELGALQRHAARRSGSAPELRQYDSILTLPKLGADGQLEDLPKSRSHLVKLDSKKAAAAVNSYFSNLVHQVVAVPTGRQTQHLPKTKVPATQRTNPPGSPIPSLTLPIKAAASQHVVSPSGMTSDATKLKRQLRSLSRAVVALNQSPRMKASKNLEALRRKLRLLKQSVASEASKWPGYGQMTLAVNNGKLDADGAGQRTGDTAALAASSARAKKGSRGRTAAGRSGDRKSPWSAHVDKANGQTYYWNAITDKSQWNKPPGWGLHGTKLTEAEQKEHKCKRCLATWTPDALRCVLNDCPHTEWVDGSTDKEARRQLILNSDIAALIRKCSAGLGARAGDGTGAGAVARESAMVQAGLVTRRQAQEAVNIKVLVQHFVLPWSEAPHVHSWLDVREATSGSGVRGLGIMSGATKTLAMGGHGDTLLSAKDAVCHTSETLEQALKPLMRRQASINAQLLKRFVNSNAPRHHNSYLDLPLRQGGGRAISYPRAVEITWKHPPQVGAVADDDGDESASLSDGGGSGGSSSHKSSGLWDEVWKLSR